LAQEALSLVADVTGCEYPKLFGHERFSPLIFADKR